MPWGETFTGKLPLPTWTHGARGVCPGHDPMGAAEARLWGEQGRCKVGTRPQHSGSGGGPWLCMGLVSAGRWSVADTPADCCVEFHSPQGPPAGRGEDGDRVEKASPASWEWAGAPPLCSYFAQRAPWWPWGRPTPQDTQSCSLLGCQGCGSRPRAAHSSCWYLLSPGSGQGGSSGAARKGEPGDTQGSHWACRGPLVLAHPGRPPGTRCPRPSHLWPCPSRLCRSGTGALGRGWSPVSRC